MEENIKSKLEDIQALIDDGYDWVRIYYSYDYSNACGDFDSEVVRLRDITEAQITLMQDYFIESCWQDEDEDEEEPCYSISIFGRRGIHSKKKAESIEYEDDERIYFDECAKSDIIGTDYDKRNAEYTLGNGTPTDKEV